MIEKKKIAIIGAGIAGMSAAWDLINAGHDVSIYEATDRIGGLAAGFKDEGWDWTLEKFYHHWFEGDKDMFKIMEEIGTRDKVIFPRPKTSFWINGKVYRSEISPSAIFLPLGFISKIRFALTGAFIKFTPNWKSLEKVTADAFLQKWMGEEAYGKFFRPMLIGKFGEHYDKVNMAWLWARVVSRSLKLGTYEGGFQAFLDDLADAITKKGVQICLDTPVQKVRSENGKVFVTSKGQEIEYDQLISTASPKIMLKLVEGLAETPYGKTMTELQSIGGMCVVFALKNPLMQDDTYWLNLPATTADKSKSEFPALALVEHTNFVSSEHYNGDTIIYVGDYTPVDHEYFQISEEELIERFKPALQKVNPNFEDSWIRKAWAWRAPYAQPLPLVNHSEKILPLETPMENVIWASMSQIYPWDRGTNYSVEMGRRAARTALGTE